MGLVNAFKAGWWVLLVGMLLIPTLACSPIPPTTQAGPQPTVAPTLITPPQLGLDGPLPAPTGPTVLTLTGKINQTNDGNALRLDPAMLERCGLVGVTVNDPWVKREIQLQGAWLADVLALAQPANAQSIQLTALDSYHVAFSLPDVEAGGILLASRTGDGGPIPIEDGGPLRVVFVGGVPSGNSADQWIWSVSMIDVR